jgi:hypothetical protein
MQSRTPERHMVYIHASGFRSLHPGHQQSPLK